MSQTPTGLPPAGWYPDSLQPAQQRYWDGISWTEHRRPLTPSATALPEPSAVSNPESNHVSTGLYAPAVIATKSATTATLSLVFGIVSIVLGFLLIPVVLGIVFGILGLRGSARNKAMTGRATGRARSVWGIILSVASLTIAVPLFIAGVNGAVGGVSTPTAADPEPSSVSFTPSPPSAPLYFETLSAHQLAVLVKNPADAKGRNVVLYGSITQFDSATGPCSFHADIENAKDISGNDYFEGVNAVFTGGDGKSNCPELANVVEGDNVRIKATVKGALSYDTQAGGSTVAPKFKEWDIAVLKGSN